MSRRRKLFGDVYHPPTATTTLVLLLLLGREFKEMCERVQKELRSQSDDDESSLEANRTLMPLERWWWAPSAGRHSRLFGEEGRRFPRKSLSACLVQHYIIEEDTSPADRDWLLLLLGNHLVVIIAFSAAALATMLAR